MGGVLCAERGPGPDICGTRRRDSPPPHAATVAVRQPGQAVRTLSGVDTSSGDISVIYARLHENRDYLQHTLLNKTDCVYKSYESKIIVTILTRHLAEKSSH